MTQLKASNFVMHMRGTEPSRSGLNACPRHYAHLWCSEYLRAGSTELFASLLESRHELSVYTSSYRSRVGIWLTFLGYGVRLTRVINQRVHDALVEKGCIARHSQKDPSYFAIDLLVDDSPPRERQREHRHPTLVRVDPDDAAWTEVVQREVMRLEHRGFASFSM